MVVNCQLSLAEDHELQLNTSDGDQQRCNRLLDNFQVLVMTHNKLISKYNSVGSKIQGNCTYTYQADIVNIFPTYHAGSTNQRSSLESDAYFES